VRSDGDHVPDSAPRGDERDADRYLEIVYDELRTIAHRELRGERESISFEPTDLVHEAYRRLVGGEGAVFNDQNHFKAVASKAIKHLLVDHARARRAIKRGGGQSPLTLSDSKAMINGAKPIDVVALSDALQTLALLHERQARVVELRYFGGMSNEEAAETLGIAIRTASKDWEMARKWLKKTLAENDADSDAN